jgi:hypothetical protein
MSVVTIAEAWPTAGRPFTVADGWMADVPALPGTQGRISQLRGGSAGQSTSAARRTRTDG